MKEYTVLMFKNKPPWDIISRADIDTFMWEKEKCYRPKAYAKMCAVENEGIYVYLVCYEKNPRAVFANTGDPIFKDSCLEMFLQFGKTDYMNIETNARGVYLSEFGSSRQERTKIGELTPYCPVVTPVSGESFWGNEVFLPEKLLTSLFPDFDLSHEGEYSGNFYKCGDDTEIPHFGAFSPVSDVSKGFHNPELFAKFIIKRAENYNG